ncbi:unknown_gene_394 [Phodopus roborovskii]|uniref:Unknown_gene_394 protein n=1 Tax=Phodopus roborovskii TaxID=109678 RepID=A0AAU9Z1R3_PHORO|nr:unknown_gene_394 [Phodopus roborovskii]
MDYPPYAAQREGTWPRSHQSKWWSVCSLPSPPIASLPEVEPSAAFGVKKEETDRSSRGLKFMLVVLSSPVDNILGNGLTIQQTPFTRGCLPLVR